MSKAVKNLPKQSNQITLLMQAMNAENEESVNLLVEQALNVIFGKGNSYSDKPSWDKQDRDAVVSLINSISPKDSIEALLVSQVIALHLSGLSIVGKENFNTMGQGLMMIRLSHQALDTLQRYRGKNQNINVNYNVANQGDAVLNTLVEAGEKLKKGT